MLEAFAQDLTIVNIQWVPGSQTMIAVGTRQFVRIYDLSEDNISPTHNLIVNDESITDFSISKNEIHDLNNPNLNTCIFLVATKNGDIFVQEVGLNFSNSK